MASLKSRRINPDKFHKSQLKFYAILIPVSAFMVLPILFIIFHAFKPIDELFAYPPRFFTTRPTLDNFKRLFTATTESNVPVSRYLFNSVVSTLFTVLFTLWVTASAGYVLSKKNFKGKDTLFTINTLALMFVPVAVSIPRFLVIVKLGLIDNFFAHILPLLAMPVGLFLVKQFIDQIPDSLIEAAKIDGASDYYILMKIIIPLIKPALSTVAILAFQTSWNSIESSAMFINDESLKTFAFYMNTLVSTTGNTVAGQGMAAAASLIMFLPNLILFIILQSRVMDTMMYSGLK
ncbi:MAG TPA: carbohydrate ABC transporter permease [Defluviitoga sp.]|jgi:multiple sugar transport system permease protein|nr:carbohydrate ABC transporter permease [Defluviitoga sp.]HOP25402.1 carbohydrate ABC transporter permease [Defluviitoga sp.]HPU59737.1 carbohydrate ABC transporter permease [Defluviitoga tunisiensis]HPZ29553.1 carbohydrate ABC transporter permease [Defluviitoga sp.]HQD63340.1 carbohydrate ABC transporter permease [Defluviitoga sp.]